MDEVGGSVWMVKLELKALEISEAFNLVTYVCVVLPLNIDTSAYRYICILCSGSEMFFVCSASCVCNLVF